MSDKVLEAINRMDPNNDGHWTVDGLAKLDTIKFLAGQPVTREELDKMAPGFNREALRNYQTQNPGGTPGRGPNGGQVEPKGSGIRVGPTEGPDASGAIDLAHNPPLKTAVLVADPTAPPEPGLVSPVDAEGKRSGIEVFTEDKLEEVRDIPNDPLAPVDADGVRTGFEAPLHPRNMGAAILGAKENEKALVEEQTERLTDGSTESPIDSEGNRTGIGPRIPAAKTSEPQKPDPQPVIRRLPDRKDEIEALAEKVDSASKEIDELQRVYVEAGKNLSEAHARRDQLNTELSTLRPKDENQKTIQTYLASQREILRKRGEAIGMVKDSGVNLRRLAQMTNPAPIDQAMRARPRQVP